MVDKYGLIQAVIVQVNDVADARGVDKCVAIINIVQNLKQLEKLLHSEEETNDSAIKELTARLDALEKEAGEDAEADSE